MPDAKTSEVSGKIGKDLLNKDGKVTELMAWATQNITNPAEMLDFFEQSGVPVSRGEEITGDYVVVHSEEKAEWCAKHEGSRLMVVQWHFYDGSTGEFAAMHLVTGAGKFILNDSAKGGMYGQLLKITGQREESDPASAANRTSTAGLFVAGGLRRNKAFWYDTRKDYTCPNGHGAAIPKLELNNVELHPMEFRAESRPTWSFDI